MQVLLTGGAGFIGSHTAVELISAGHEVVIVDDLSNSSYRMIENIQRITGKNVLFYRENVADSTALRRIFSENAIDAVIHFAGFKAVGESVKKPLAYYRNNLDSAITLLECMREFSCKRFVFSSSATVYGVNAPIPYTEESRPGDCSNPYGWTKFMIERILQDTAQADASLSVVLLRYFNPIGAHESGLIGELPNGIPNNLMPYITQVASGIREKLSVFGDDYDTPDGTGVRDYIHVMDLARGHLAALDYAAVHSGVEAFNLGTGVGCSVLDVVHTFERVNGVAIPYAVAPRRAGDLPAFYADPAKARRMLHWEARCTLEDMCRDAWRWQQNCEKMSDA